MVFHLQYLGAESDLQSKETYGNLSTINMQILAKIYNLQNLPSPNVCLRL